MRMAVLLGTMIAALATAFAQAPEEAKAKERPETADPAVRCVLEGVPWIGFYRGDSRGPEDDPFPACVRAFLEYRKENPGLQPRQTNDPWHVVHVYIKGTCGASPVRRAGSGGRGDGGEGRREAGGDVEGADGECGWEAVTGPPCRRTVALSL
jgi:hypothetical protein